MYLASPRAAAAFGALLAALATGPRTLAAQATGDTTSAAASAPTTPVTPVMPADARPRAPRPLGKHIPALTIGLTATTALLLPADRAITHHVRAPGPQRSAFLRESTDIFDKWGGPYVRRAGPALFLLGLVSRSESLTDAGLHATETYVTATVSVLTVKAIAGRARPSTVGDARPYDFKLGRGFPRRAPYSSFPSGHTTVSFAFASTIASEAGHWWPEHQRLIGTLAYSAAVLDGLSRVYRDGHWASDVSAGALVGTVNGLVVTRFQHAHPNNLVDGLVRRVFFAPAPSGDLQIGWTTRF
jgi:membrane-associated phospholipid phosphatase